MTKRLTRAVVVLSSVALAAACIVTCSRREAPTSAPVASATAPATALVTQSAGAPLTVTVKDLRNRKGVLIFGVFESPEGFPNTQSKSVYWEVKAAEGGSLTFTANLPPGRYAASVLHDENRSGDMDRGGLGVPLEGYGVTSNPKPKMRAATFEEATFTLPAEGKEMTISLQYQFF